MSTTEFSPLSETLPYWPDHLLAKPEFLDEIGISDFKIAERNDALEASGKLLWFREMAFEIAGVDALSIVLASSGGHTEVPFDVDLWPAFELRVPQITVTFRIKSELLRPVKLENGNWVERLDANGNLKPAEIVLNGVGLLANREGDLELLMPSGAPKLTLDAVQLGDSGVIVEIDDLSPYFSRRQQRPAGLDPSFRGFTASSIKIHLPNGFDLPLAPETLLFQDVALGTGGFSGKATGQWTPVFNETSHAFEQNGAGNILGTPFGLRSLAIDFEQSIPVDCELKGEILIPFFDERVAVDLSIGADGSVRVALSATQPAGVIFDSGLVTFEKVGLLKMTLDSIAFDLTDGVFTVKLAGKIKPLVGAANGLKWPTFDVQELSINSEGEVNITGGWIELPKAYTLNLALFNLEITKFGMGRTDKGEKYLGFSGGLNLVKGIPAGASVEGLRIIWGETSDPRLTMEGVGVEFNIPGTLDFKGAVSYREPTATLRAFTGDLTLNLSKLKLHLDAKVVFGSDLDVSGNRFKYFAMYVEGEFGTGIPLFNTGLSITAIAALFSVNYAPHKPEEWMWYSMDQATSWFHKPAKGVTDIVHKWAPESGALGFGAGVTLRTNSDNGYLFNGKFLLLFLFPGPVVMIEGRCDFLKRPPTKDDAQEPMFHSLLVVDFKAGYFLIGLDAKWKYDADTGKLIEIAGSAEAYFNFHDPRQWHIYVGRVQLEQRIRASFASAFAANAYFMLDPKNLALGVWIGKQQHYQFGPVSADMDAWLDANATLSFRPAHLTTGIWVHGLFAIRVFRFRLGLGIDARLAAEVSKPFHIVGTLTITVQTRLKDFEFELKLEWGPQPMRPAIAEPFKDAGIAHLKSTVDWPMLPNKPVPIVPVDGRPYLTFDLPVHDKTPVTLNPSTDPGWLTVGDPSTGEGTARVRYDLITVAIEKYDGSTWTAVPDLYGSWAAGSSQCRLMLYAKTPFEITDNSAMWNPWVADNLPDYPCPVVHDVKLCVDLEKADPKVLFTSAWKDATHPEIVVRWTDGPHRVAATPTPIAGQYQGILFSPMSTAAAFALNTSGGTISVIDTTTDQISGAPIVVGNSPFRAAVTTNGARIVLVKRDNHLVVVDVASRTLDGSPISLTSPFAVAVHPDGVRAYVTSDQSKSIAVVDLVARKLLYDIPVPAITAGLAILPNGTRVYVAHPVASTISVIDATSNTLVGPPIPALPRMPYLVVSNDGATLFVSGDPDNVAVLNTATNQLVMRIITGHTPSGMVLTPDGTRLYVANAGSDTVSVIDVTSLQVIATIATGPLPYAIAVTPDGTKVYVADMKGNDITVIDTATNQAAAARIAVGFSPNDIVIPSHATPVSTGVEIEVPAGSAVVEIVAYQPTGGHLVGTVSDPPGFETHEEIPKGSILRLDADTLKIQDGIRRIRVKCDHDWILMRVCYTRPDLLGGLAELNHLHDQLQQGVNVWGKSAAVLEPFTDYRLHATVERTIAGRGALSDWYESNPFDSTWPFTTGGPPGLVELLPPNNVPADKSAIGLDDLTRYVEQTAPPTLTPAGARPELTRPVYCAYDVGVSFNEDYVDRMYELAERDLAIQIYDSSDWPVRDVDGRLAVMANAWGDAAEVQLTETRQLWIEVLNAASCLPDEIAIDTLPRNKTLDAGDHVLARNTLHEARLVPLLLRAPIPSVSANWTMDVLPHGGPMLKRTGGKPVASADWTDVLVRVEIQPAAAGPSGVAFRHQAQGYYLLSIDVNLGHASLIRVVGGVATQLAVRPFSYDATKSYRFSIEAIGPRLRVEQDGKLLLGADDVTHPKGTIALFPWTGGKPQLFDVSVHDFSKGAPVAYRFPFTTSGYVDFVHQVHAHQDMTWPGTLPATVDLAAVAVRVSDPSAPVSEGEARAYGIVADTLLGTAALQLPAQLEVTRVDQASGLAALLIRGDEPFDWRRTKLTVLQADDVANPLVSPDRMKVIGAAFGWTQLGADGVEVLLRESLDPTGCRIEARLAPRPLRETSEPALFTDRFAEDELTGWTLANQLPTGSTSQSSTWQTVDGWLRLTNTITGGGGDPEFLGTFASAGDPTWIDVAFTIRVRCQLGGATGIVFCSSGLDDYYRFSMDSKLGYRQLVKKVAGVFTELWRDDVAYDPQLEYEVTVIAVGGSLRGFIDSVPLFAVEDSTHVAGIIACYVSDNEAEFSEVSVDSAARVAAEWLLDERFDLGPPDRWTFDSDRQWNVVNNALVAPPNTASAVAGESTWSDYRLSLLVDAGPTGATEVVFRRQASDRYYALRFDADAASVNLLKVVGGKETTFWQQAWSPGAMLVTVDCVGTTIVCYLNARAVAGVTDADLAAGQIGIHVRGATGSTITEVRVAPAAWTLWYEFGSETLCAAGTHFAVHGSEFDIGPHPVQPGTMRRFAAPHAHVPRLPNGGADLRIVAAGGRVEHARHFLPYDAFKPIDVDLMRNADGTGFFLLTKPESTFRMGTYRLALHYARKKAGVIPILSRAGSQAPEYANLDIAVAS